MGFSGSATAAAGGCVIFAAMGWSRSPMPNARTGRKRMRAKLAEIKNQLRARIDAPPGETGKWPRTVVRGLLSIPRGAGQPASLPRP